MACCLNAAAAVGLNVDWRGGWERPEHGLLTHPLHVVRWSCLVRKCKILCSRGLVVSVSVAGGGHQIGQHLLFCVLWPARGDQENEGGHWAAVAMN